jgi:CubicO group peptidase (beta-lactamase class C family)
MQSKWTVIVILVLIAFTCEVITTKTHDWTTVTNILNSAITDKAFPGCVALIADESGVLYSNALGHLTYPGDEQSNIPMTLNTRFDMASVTKVLVTTSATALLFQHGILPSLSLRVSEIFPEFGVNGKELITIENLLLHNAGLKPDPVPGYATKEFGCPETSKYHPQLSFSCAEKIYNATMAQKLQHPVGSVFVYSDLSMITMQYVIGYYVKYYNLVSGSDLLSSCKAAAVGQGQLTCYYEAFARKHLFEALKLNNSTFITADNVNNYKKNEFAPAWRDESYRHELIQGYVSDSNGYSDGGVAGHAGLFSVIQDVYSLLRKLMFPEPNSFLKESIIQLFTTVKNKNQSSRALGWDTNIHDPGTISSCGTLSELTYMHTGYTGTNCCNDPKRKLITILLTNRVYPFSNNTKISQVRNDFNTAVQQIYDQGL